MFEIEGHKYTISGLALGGLGGFLLHKKLKVSKGYGIAIGSILGLIVGFQITKEQGKKARELSKRTEALLMQDTRNKMIAEGKMTPTGEKVVK